MEPVFIGEAEPGSTPSKHLPSVSTQRGKHVCVARYMPSPRRQGCAAQPRAGIYTVGWLVCVLSLYTPELSRSGSVLFTWNRINHHIAIHNAPASVMATTHTSWPLNARQPPWWLPRLGQLSSAPTNELREITEAATAVRDALNAGYYPPSTRQAADQEFETQETTEQEAAKQTALKEEAASREVAKHVLNSVLPCNGFQGTDSRPFTVSVWWQVFDGVNSL